MDSLEGASITRCLVSIVRDGRSDGAGLESIVEGGARNKILLHVLRVLNVEGSLRREQESRLRKIIRIVDKLSHLLKSYEHVFFKLVKPVAYVPADIDVLMLSSQVGAAAREIMGLGYRIVARDPYCITLTKDDSIIDLYTHPSIGGVILLDGQKLLEHVVIRSFNGVEINALERYAESLVAAVHAIYKERIYTLNDFFTTDEWISRRTLRLARDLRCERAVEAAVRLNSMISRGMLKTPYKIDAPVWLGILFEKFKDDHLTRTTSMNMLRTLTKKGAGKLLISRFTRETY